MSENQAGDGHPTHPEGARVEPSVQAVLMSTVARDNELNRQAGNPWSIPVDEDTKFGLDLSDNGHNNQLVVAVNNDSSTSYAHIGHYDPAQGKFLSYPEVILPEEFAVIEDLARKTRQDKTRQDKTTNSITYDFDTDVITDLRRRHKEALEQDGFIYALADRSNKLKPPGDAVLIDDATSYFVCLTPKLGGYNPLDPSSATPDDVFMTDEAFVSIQFEGDFFMKNGVPQRRANSFIHLGGRDLDDPEGKFIPDPTLVTQPEFDRVLGLTQELQQLKAGSYPNLSTEFVALKNGGANKK